MSKWISSSTEVLATVAEAQRAVPDKNLELGELPSGRALGVRRELQSDSLGLTLEHTDCPPEYGARYSQEIGRLYDPLGWDSPFSIHTKVMLQLTWSCGLGWDDLLPADTYDC